MEDQGRRRTQRRSKRAKNQERVKNQKVCGREVGGREVRLGAGKVLGRGDRGGGEVLRGARILYQVLAMLREPGGQRFGMLSWHHS